MNAIILAILLGFLLGVAGITASYIIARIIAAVIARADRIERAEEWRDSLINDRAHGDVVQFPKVNHPEHNGNFIP